MLLATVVAMDPTAAAVTVPSAPKYEPTTADVAAAIPPAITLLTVSLSDGFFTTPDTAVPVAGTGLITWLTAGACAREIRGTAVGTGGPPACAGPPLTPGAGRQPIDPAGAGSPYGPTGAESPPTAGGVGNPTGPG
jgi:hypothetical protein